MNSTISSDTQKWAEFGDYFGGTLNALFAFINVCVTIWLTITVNTFTKRNTENQIQSERKIATIHLRHDALKELRNDLDQKYSIWKSEILSAENAIACQSSVIRFSSNYSYLFDGETIEACHNFINQINNAIVFIIDQNSTSAKECMIQIHMNKIVLYATIGRKIIQ